MSSQIVFIDVGSYNVNVTPYYLDFMYTAELSKTATVKMSSAMNVHLDFN